MSDDGYASVMNRAMAICDDEGEVYEECRESNHEEEQTHLPPVNLVDKPTTKKNGIKIITPKKKRKSSKKQSTDKSEEPSIKKTKKKPSIKKKSVQKVENSVSTKKTMTKLERLQHRMRSIEERKQKVEKLIKEASSKKTTKPDTKVPSTKFQTTFRFSGITRIPPYISTSLERLLKNIITSKSKVKESGKSTVRASTIKRIRQAVLYDYPIYLGLFSQLLNHERRVHGCIL